MRVRLVMRDSAPNTTEHTQKNDRRVRVVMARILPKIAGIGDERVLRVFLQNTVR
jgi:hypothetical protein